MPPYSICDVCDQPLDLCECKECNYCGKKIESEFDFCSEECQENHNTLVDEKIKMDS